MVILLQLVQLFQYNRSCVITRAVLLHYLRLPHWSTRTLLFACKLLCHEQRIRWIRHRHINPHWGDRCTDSNPVCLHMPADTSVLVWCYEVQPHVITDLAYTITTWHKTTQTNGSMIIFKWIHQQFCCNVFFNGQNTNWNSLNLFFKSFHNLGRGLLQLIPSPQHGSWLISSEPHKTGIK